MKNKRSICRMLSAAVVTVLLYLLLPGKIQQTTFSFFFYFFFFFLFSFPENRLCHFKQIVSYSLLEMSKLVSGEKRKNISKCHLLKFFTQHVSFVNYCANVHCCP